MITTTRYNIRSVQNMMAQIEDWITQSNDTLCNEESKDYPNEERMDILNNRIDSLQEAYDALQNIE